MQTVGMSIAEAKAHLGKNVSVTYTDRSGETKTTVTYVYDVAYVPSYGGCIIGESGDIWLDKVLEVKEVA